jgi:hypothetical protein
VDGLGLGEGGGSETLSSRRRRIRCSGWLGPGGRGVVVKGCHPEGVVFGIVDGLGLGGEGKVVT